MSYMGNRIRITGPCARLVYAAMGGGGLFAAACGSAVSSGPSASPSSTKPAATQPVGEPNSSSSAAKPKWQQPSSTHSAAAPVSSPGDQSIDWVCSVLPASADSAILGQPVQGYRAFESGVGGPVCTFGAGPVQTSTGLKFHVLAT